MITWKCAEARKQPAHFIDKKTFFLIVVFLSFFCFIPFKNILADSQIIYPDVNFWTQATQMDCTNINDTDMYIAGLHNSYGQPISQSYLQFTLPILPKYATSTVITLYLYMGITHTNDTDPIYFSTNLSSGQLFNYNSPYCDNITSPQPTNYALTFYWINHSPDWKPVIITPYIDYPTNLKQQFYLWTNFQGNSNFNFQSLSQTNAPYIELTYTINAPPLPSNDISIITATDKDGNVTTYYLPVILYFLVVTILAFILIVIFMFYTIYK
jgi:hypothetical protein